MIDNPGILIGAGLVGLVLLLMWLTTVSDVVARKDMAATERTFWLLVIVLVPVFGMFFYWSNNKAPRRP